jgi:hypothetical protein
VTRVAIGRGENRVTVTRKRYTWIWDKSLTSVTQWLDCGSEWLDRGGGAVQVLNVKLYPPVYSSVRAFVTGCIQGSELAIKWSLELDFRVRLHGDGTTGPSRFKIALCQKVSVPLIHWILEDSEAVPDSGDPVILWIVLRDCTGWRE